MAFPRSSPVTFRPSGLSDAVDGTNAPAGAMASLAELVHDPSTAGVVVPRPAAVVATVFASFSSPEFVSGELVVGDIAYGMVGTARNAGKDEPYVYNILTGNFLTVAGVLNANTPTSPAATGEWTPPILAQVAGRIIVTHPGFPGGATKFGWIDVSGFTLTTTGNTNTSTLITGNPSVLGVQPGHTIVGTNIPAAATVVSTTQFVLRVVGVTHGTTTLDNLSSVSGVALGQSVEGLGIPAGTTVTAVAPGVVTMSAAATGSGAIDVTFTGSTITISAPATGSTAGSTFTIAGGTRAAPLWGAGDTDRNPLVSVPVGVAQMNGRAWFACGVDGIVFSDSGFPCRASNTVAVQALTPNDGLPVTAIGALQLTSLLGGIVKSLIAFQGASKMQQITGDQVTANLTMNSLPVGTGTLAPLSICSTENGLVFASPQGMRIIDSAAKVSSPIGEGGGGVTVPFIYALVPSRICAAASADTIRVSVESSLSGGPREFWFNLTRKQWSGPHSFPASLIQPWRNSFLMSPLADAGSLWKSDSAPSPSSVYVENGNLLTWTFQPSPLPDTGQMAMNALVEMTAAISLAPGTAATVVAQDMDGGYLDMATIDSPSGATIWGAFNWGQALWGGSGAVFQQRSVDWNVPLVFKQLNLQFKGASNYNVRIGNINMRYEILGYKLQVA